MNPLAWNPSLYTAIVVTFALVAAAWCVVQRQRKGPSGFVRNPLTDPYALALLVDGPVLALRIAIFSLVQKNILGVAAGQVRLLKAEDLLKCESPFERQVAERAGAGTPTATLLTDNALLGATRAHESPLRQEGLLADEALRGDHRRLALICFGVTAGLLAVKFISDLVRDDRGAGASVIGILIVGVVFLPLALLPPRLSPRGRDTLVELRRHYGATRSGYTGGGTQGLILAALFGFAALTKSEQAVARIIEARPGR